MSDTGMTDTLSIVQGLMRDYFDDDTLIIRPDTTAADIEAWDSMNHLNIIAGIEDRFRIKFKNSDVEALHNVGDLVATIDRKIAGR